MSIRLTCISKAAGNHENPHEGITNLGWINEHNNVTGYNTRAEVVAFVELNGDKSAYVKDDLTGRVAYVGVVVPPYPRQKFLRTHADGYYNDNLLSLDECRG